MSDPDVTAALAKLPASVRTMLRQQCAGDWSRVSYDGTSFTVHNKPKKSPAKPPAKRVAKKPAAKKAPAKVTKPPVPTPDPARAAAAKQAAERRAETKRRQEEQARLDEAKRLHAARVAQVKSTGSPDDPWVECGEVDIHDPHWYQLDGAGEHMACTGSGLPEVYMVPAFYPDPQPDLPGYPFEPPRQPEPWEPAEQLQVEPDPEPEPEQELAAPVAKLVGTEPVACRKCRETGHTHYTCPRRSVRTYKIPPVDPSVVDDAMLTAHSNTLLDLCRNGLPPEIGYKVKEDVLALYGVDLDLLDACLRNPTSVEIRPETRSKEKRYCILGFHRGDLQVILGMLNPVTPAVIATYAGSRLDPDGHHVNHSGGGAGGSKSQGLPKTGRQVATRLRARGATVEMDPRVKTVEVFYREQSLGKIATDGDRKTSENDYQRTIRKMEAIDRRD